MNSPTSWTRRDGYEIDRTRARLDLPFLVDFLGTTYWAATVAADVLERSIDHSDPFGLYDRTGTTVGFARLVTDASRFAWLSDVFVVPEHRGKGLGRWLVETIVACPDYREIGLWCLATCDAHGLYGQVGFEAIKEPSRFMVRRGGTREGASEQC